MSLEIVKPGVNINFVGNRYYAFLISGLLLLASITSIIWHQGLNLGVDFRGGLNLQILLTDPNVEADEIRRILTEGGIEISSLQDFGQGEREYLINIPPADDNTGERELNLSQKVMGLLNGALGDKVELRREEMVGPKVGGDLRQKALYAIYYSILMIIIYISGRFEQKWGSSAMFMAILIGVIYLMSLFGLGVGTLIVIALIVTLITCYVMRFSYALGSILALIHDVVITVGIFSILNKEITLTFVAAILTIIGYSLNDSIIVFDRIRENLRRLKGKTDLATTINKSVNETLSRTILTSGTTMMAVISLYFLGGPVNQDFALALFIGMTVGTFSSVFIASPLLLLWEKKKIA
ncbi:MAG: protein translocase subunit SecF [Deltaproteobacteria bacterium]|jgi:preprotein translocase subunit SecF|nr:protein translocase subunit SecF [Deltaproteobacteria bacterium]